MLAVNLRGDLAKLSDAELAERLEAAWREYEAAPRSGWWWNWSDRPSRGPIRHPRAYRFLMLLQGSSGSPFDLLLSLAFSSKRFAHRLRPNSELSVCEIRDIMDEIERRLKHRNKSAA
jgi:hypothetical protein